MKKIFFALAVLLVAATSCTKNEGTIDLHVYTNTLSVDGEKANVFQAHYFVSDGATSLCFFAGSYRMDIELPDSKLGKSYTMREDGSDWNFYCVLDQQYYGNGTDMNNVKSGNAYIRKNGDGQYECHFEVTLSNGKKLNGSYKGTFSADPL